MKRFALGLEYSGEAYQGWQRQREGIPTIQQTLENALSSVADARILAVCAGRTDRGVHASEQVVHFDTSVERDLRAWLMGTNAYLPRDIRVTWVCPVTHEFDARRDATSRRYQYYIYTRRISPSIARSQITWNYRPLAAPKMHLAAQTLLGTHDFTSFRAMSCEAKTPIRTVSNIQVTETGGLICLDITANAFLHHMVRNIAGSLMEIGSGKREEGWLSEVLAAKDRRAAGMMADPEGLYLVKVSYSPKYMLPNLSTPIGPWFASVTR